MFSFKWMSVWQSVAAIQEEVLYIYEVKLWPVYNVCTWAMTPFS